MRVLSVRSKRLFFIVRLIVYSLKIIGLAPFSVSIEKPSNINPYDSRIQAFFPSKFGLAYNSLLLVPVIILVHIFLPPNFFYKIDAGEFIMNILFAIWSAKISLLVFTGCLVVICWASEQKNAARIMNRLLEVDICLSDLKKQPFDKRALIFLCVHGVLNACMWISYWIWMRNYSDKKVSVYLVIKMPEYAIYWFMIEYVTIVGLVFRDLQTVNKYLLDIEQFENYLSRLPVVNGDIRPVVNVSNGRIASLKLLRSVRTTLSELCEDIGDFFSLPILFCIASCFVTIFEALYYTTQMTEVYPLRFIAHCVVAMVLQHIYPIVSLTLNVTQTKKEAELTGQIVHKLLAVAKTEEVKEELEQFSLQLLHEKVNFTAYGFFTLDFTLLQSMLGGVAGYAIILTQFGSSVCNCNCNCKNISTGIIVLSLSADSTDQFVKEMVTRLKLVKITIK